MYMEGCVIYIFVVVKIHQVISLLLRRSIRYDRSISCFMMWPAHTNNMLCFVLGCIFKTKFRYERCQLLFCFILLFFCLCNVWTVIKRLADQFDQFWEILIIWVRLKKSYKLRKASAEQIPPITLLVSYKILITTSTNINIHKDNKTRTKHCSFLFHHPLFVCSHL